MRGRKLSNVAGTLIGCCLALGVAIAQEQQPPPPIGRLVDVGGFRLHINCTGKGGPTVVLISGAGDFSFDWGPTQEAVSRFARVCSYDRAGNAWSDLGPIPRTMHQEAYELHLLLQRAGEKPSFILVGHSIGGLIARVYVNDFPNEAAGVVLVDATDDDTQLMYQGKIVRVRDSATGRPIPSVQTMQSSPPKPPTAEDLKQAEFNQKLFGAPKIEPPFDKLPQSLQTLRLWALTHPKLSARSDDYWPDELQQLHQQRQQTPHPLGDRPLAVLIAGVREPTPNGVTDEQWTAIQEEKRHQKIASANLSRNSTVVVDKKSGHHLQLDDPQLLVRAIQTIRDAAAHHKSIEHVSIEGP
jgi:pimeloyl-ACP methyl ester carboxylesterase